MPIMKFGCAGLDPFPFLVLGLYDFYNLFHHPPTYGTTGLFLPEFLTASITTNLMSQFPMNKTRIFGLLTTYLTKGKKCLVRYIGYSVVRLFV